MPRLSSQPILSASTDYPFRFGYPVKLKIMSFQGAYYIYRIFTWLPCRTENFVGLNALAPYGIASSARHGESRLVQRTFSAA